IVGFAPPSGNQLELRPADGQIRSLVDWNIRFVAPKIFEIELVSEELLGEDIGCVKLPFQLFRIITSSIKLRTRIQIAKIWMTTNMVPVRMSDKDSRDWRQSRHMRLQRLVGVFCEIRACARVDADEFLPIPGYHEVVFREFEPG